MKSSIRALQYNTSQHQIHVVGSTAPLAVRMTEVQGSLRYPRVPEVAYRTA
jgi:hypothetical protein